MKNQRRIVFPKLFLNKMQKKTSKESFWNLRCSKESSLREKIFGLRIEAIDLIIQYLDGLAKEPVDIIVERISDVLSRDEAKAILGENPQYFGLPEGTWSRLCRTPLLYPTFKNSYFYAFYRNNLL